jgi:hypothetical protein
MVLDKCITALLVVLLSPLLLVQYIKQRRELAKFNVQEK